MDISTLRRHKRYRSSTVLLTIVDGCNYQGAPTLTESHTETSAELSQAGERNTSRQHFHSLIIPCIDCEVSRHDVHSY